MIIKKDSDIVKAKVKSKSLALKSKKESSDEECLTSGSEDEDFGMANNKKTFQRSRDDKNSKSDRKCFRCGDPNHLIGECPKPPKDKNQRAFVGGAWSDSGEEDDEKVKNKTCLVAQASSEHMLKIENEKLKEEALKLTKFKKSTHCLNEMLSNQKPSGDKLGLGFNSFEASSSRTKEIKFVKAQKKAYSNGASKELVRKLPKLKFDQQFCDACKIGKQAHASHKAKNIVSMTRYLELHHVDLFVPSAIRCYGGNHYTLIIVDDYSKYTWTRFLKDKTEAFDQLKIFSKKIQNQLGCTLVSIRTNHDREIDNEVKFGEFCNANGFIHNFSAPRTPQSNGVVERKNRTL
ncbi:retrovirus-related pol polyprotein from transposon TNT 1-94 [Tanacetum coccineum]